MWGAGEATSILSDFAASRVGLFPVKMATGAGWQPPYNTSTSTTKYPPCTTSSMLYDGSLTLEYTQDLHLKMSKKIAQLTKVRGREWVKLRGVVQSFRACKWSITVITVLVLHVVCKHCAHFFLYFSLTLVCWHFEAGALHACRVQRSNTQAG